MTRNGGIACSSPCFTGMQRYHPFLSRIIRDGVYQPVVPLPFVLLANFLRNDVVSGQQQIHFTQRPESVPFQHRPNHSGNLPTHIALLYIRRFQHVLRMCLVPASPVSARYQAVFPLQLIGDPFAASCFELVRQLLPVAVHTQGDDMDMLARDVVVLEYDVRLFAVSHLFHVFPGDVL